MAHNKSIIIDTTGEETNSPGVDVGVHLKRLRRLHTMSQRELAKRAGVTNTTISLIEQNKVSPSIASLKKILDAFPISIIDFFTGNLKSRNRVVFRHDELAEIGSGDISFLLVGAGKQDRLLQVLRERYPPGADTGPETYAHEGEEAGIVIKGRVEMTVGDDVFILEAGDGYYFDSSQPHRFRNIGEDEVEIFSAASKPSM